jgi:hypothetical protein
MCGIVGYINGSYSNYLYDKRKFIEQALIIDTLRGDDGAGLFTVGNKGQVKLHKEAVDGYGFVSSEQFVKVFPANDWGEYRFAVGHNRSATIGGISGEATHPFREGPITLVHNGTIHDTTKLKASQHELKAENDSHTICHNLAISSPEEVISTLVGAFALVWHDSRDDSLNLVRNNQRPLFIAKARAHNTLYFASEGEMLYWLDARITLGLQDIVSLKPASWLKFRGEGPSLMLPEFKQVQLYVPEAYSYRGPKHSPTRYSGYGMYSGDYEDGDAWDVVTRKPAEPAPTTTAVVPVTKPADPPHPSVRYTAISVNGKKQPIPKDMEYDLMDYCLYLDETYKFVPCRADPQNLQWLNITGYLTDVPDVKGNILACLYGIPSDVWNKANNRMWEVRPVGVKGIDADLDIIVCRLVGTSPKGGHAVLPNSRVLPRDPVKRSEVGSYEAPTMLPGPHGQGMLLNDWLKATESGCIQCGGLLKPEDASRVEWTNDRKDPLCFECQKELEQWNAGKGQQQQQQKAVH